jgi:hypothetical protein
MPSIDQLRAALGPELVKFEQKKVREAERRKADKARLRKLRRGSNWQAIANELQFQMQELLDGTRYNPQTDKLIREKEMLLLKMEYGQHELFSAKFEQRRLKVEVSQLRAALGERDGTIQFPEADHTPETISQTFQALGYRASKRTVISWLGQWHNRKHANNEEKPTRWIFPNDDWGKEELKNFVDWCRNTQKLRKKRT